MRVISIIELSIGYRILDRHKIQLLNSVITRRMVFSVISQEELLKTR